MAPQDTYIEEEDELCPLCIEEFDLQDRFFKPCPCGYQICQFCFNNIRNNVNGLCPACRRPYNDKTIEWRTPSAEEIAEYEARKQSNNKKRLTDQRQKETQKRESEKDSRKNLVGVRVVQKNLVYVTGLTPTVREDELLKTLRKPEFFGQYGNIQKISISNRKGTDGHNQSLGIYVTFEKKEDAARCIQAVNGSQNGDRILRAQLGTTKYCSAWLRHEQCNNRQCMFLHELGDEEDSYSRQDLSSLNSLNSLGNQQRPAVNAGTSRSASRQQVHAQVQQQGLQSQQQAAQPQQQAAQPMTRSLSKEGSENDDGSALPSSANWARNPQARSRQGSHATSGAAPSPAISNALPNTTEVGPETINQPSQEATAESSAEHGAVIATSSETEPVTTELDPLQAFLKKIMDSLGKSGELPTPLGDHTDVGAHPPLFDPRGGEKRRALREEEDARLADEQDANSDAAEPTEIETGRSGSLALGGEPEDRGHGRDAPGFDMRRGSQPPIQRGSNEGIFGPAFGTGFGQPAGAVGSIGARTLTPQQHGLMRPQGSFVDSLPPGLTSQSNLFQGQGQGHIRQGSRYSFANDNRDTAATSVKLAANPRVMAQQSAMMPSSFHSPAGATPYYGSSMPGPPPGIKSTATPPNLFGQHGFGGFGNAPKDSNELHSILNRGRGAGNQALDAGKREFMFSSFPNQFPPSTSSTPAPVSSFMGPLYGAQPGAFQDFGSKQKKKGRKHRHANTSSFGGSGLVDLADPSILQARIQHQQQSNAGVGQALFGAQSQDDELPSLDEAMDQVDALVSDDVLVPTAPLFPRGFDGFSNPTTPAIPPGFPPGFLPQARMSPLGSQVSSLDGTRGRQTPIPIALPILPAKPSGSALSTAVKKTPGPAGPDAKKSIKALTIESGLSKAIASQSSKLKQPKLLQDEDFPALHTPKAASSAVSTPPVSSKPAIGSRQSTAAAKKTTEKASEQKARQKDGRAVERAAEKNAGAKSSGKPKTLEKTTGDSKAAAEKRSGESKVNAKTPLKRPTPGVLNIAAATTAAQSKVVESTASASEKTTSDRDGYPALPTPNSASVSSPLARTAPKSVRLLPTPKTETPPTLSTSSQQAISAGPTIRSAVASAAAAIVGRPGTPGSEVISDSASIFSASVSASRTNSPPPGGMVGSAPMRTTTRSQQRKQRKDAGKRDAPPTVAAVPVPEPEAEIGPIIGRKKKQKKDKGKEKVGSAHATPSGSRPETPIGQQVSVLATPAKEGKEIKQDGKQEAKAEIQVEVKEETSTYRSTANETTNVLDDKAPRKVATSVKKEGADGGADLSNGSDPTPLQIFQDLVHAGLLAVAPENLELFKSFNSHRPETIPGMGEYAFPPGHGTTLQRDGAPHNRLGNNSVIGEEDTTAMLAGHVVRKVVDGVRILLTADFDCVRNLSEEEESRFLEYQNRIREDASNPAAYAHQRNEASGGFSLIKGRAVPNGLPSYWPQSAAAYSPDPLSKVQRDEAIYYINQYVMPRLNLGPANLNMQGPAWRSVFPDGKVNVAATAARLNAIAPWIYGNSLNNEGAAKAEDGHQDAAAPELNYPGPVGSFDDSTPILGGLGLPESNAMSSASSSSLEAALPQAVLEAAYAKRRALPMTAPAGQPSVSAIAGLLSNTGAASSSAAAMSMAAFLAGVPQSAMADLPADKARLAHGAAATMTAAASQAASSLLANLPSSTTAALPDLTPYMAKTTAGAAAAVPTPLPATPLRAPSSGSGSGSGSLSQRPYTHAPIMKLEDAESQLALARKETEKLEKGLNGLMKRNRRLLVGNH